MVFHRSTQWQCGNVCHPAHSKQDSQGQGDHPRDWAALQMSKNNLVAFSQSIKSRKIILLMLPGQYQVTVAVLLKIKLWRGIIGTGSVGTRRLVMRRFFESNCYDKLPENVMISTEFSRLSCYLHGSHRHHSFHEVHGGMLLIQSWCLMFHYFETFKGLWWIMGCKPNMPILVAFYSSSLEQAFHRDLSQRYTPKIPPRSRDS